MKCGKRGHATEKCYKKYGAALGVKGAGIQVTGVMIDGKFYLDPESKKKVRNSSSEEEEQIPPKN
jgi:hypothetical protein